MTAEELISRQDLLPCFDGARRSGEWLFRYCPCHADGSKHHGRGGESLGLSDQGVLRCFAGCSFKDIIEVLRGPHATRAPALTSIHRQAPAEKLVKLYEYRSEDGKRVLAEKGRFESGDGRKSFKWRLPKVEGWPAPSGVNLEELPLYGAWLLAEQKDEPVYFVEGEKACEACWEQGLLAVTHGGGASTKNFGQSLDVLRGRCVFLWADNDAPGRSFMQLIGARLAGIAGTTRPLFVEVPEKGDAFDYFAAGGTVGDLESKSPSKPVVHVLGQDSLRVTVPTIGGPVNLFFNEMEKTSRALDAEVVIATFASGEQPYSQRMNLLSSSARTELRRDLDSMWGKDYGWPQVLNTALALARDTYLRQDRGIDVFEIPDPVSELLLVPPLIVADGPTVFFGDGSSGKSYILIRLALCVGMGIPFCGLKTPQVPVLYIDYEDSAPNFRRRLKRLVQGFLPSELDHRGWPDQMDEPPPAMVYYWPARGIPLKDQVDAIRRKCEKDGIGLLIIDSAAPACGGPPEDSEAALAYFRALGKLGMPSVTIAHINKGGDTKKPFGSSFWHNEPRRTWFVSRVQEEESDEIDIGLYCRKVNDGPLPAPLAFHVSFSPTLNGPVRLSMASIQQVPELLDQTSLRNRVWAVLEGREMTIRQIVEETDADAKAVEKVLVRGPFARSGEVQTSGRPALLWARRYDG